MRQSASGDHHLVRQGRKNIVFACQAIEPESNTVLFTHGLPPGNDRDHFAPALVQRGQAALATGPVGRLEDSDVMTAPGRDTGCLRARRWNSKLALCSLNPLSTKPAAAQAGQTWQGAIATSAPECRSTAGKLWPRARPTAPEPGAGIVRDLRQASPGQLRCALRLRTHMLAGRVPRTAARLSWRRNRAGGNAPARHPMITATLPMRCPAPIGGTPASNRRPARPLGAAPKRPAGLSTLRISRPEAPRCHPPRWYRRRDGAHARHGPDRVRR
jgi:hypothetical protein